MSAGIFDRSAWEKFRVKDRVKARVIEDLCFEIEKQWQNKSHAQYGQHVDTLLRSERVRKLAQELQSIGCGPTVHNEYVVALWALALVHNKNAAVLSIANHGS